MLGLASGVTTIQGKTYQLRPYSAVNLERLNTKGAEFVDLLMKGEIDEFEYYNRILPIVIADEPAWDVYAEDFDGREAENAILSFVPPSKQAYLLLNGFQPA